MTPKDPCFPRVGKCVGVGLGHRVCVGCVCVGGGWVGWWGGVGGGRGAGVVGVVETSKLVNMETSSTDWRSL